MILDIGDKGINLYPWAVGDYCVSLKMLKLPLKQIYSFKLTMLWLSLSSALSLPKYFTPICTPRLRPRCHVALILRCASIRVSGKPSNAKTRWHLGLSRGVHIGMKYLGKENEEERDNHSIVSLNEYICL